MFCRASTLIAVLLTVFVGPASAQSAQKPATQEGDYIAHDFRFKSGETLPELRLHYTTLGKPLRDPNGKVTNAAMCCMAREAPANSFWRRNLPMCCSDPASR